MKFSLAIEDTGDYSPSRTLSPTESIKSTPVKNTPNQSPTSNKHPLDAFLVYGNPLNLYRNRNYTKSPHLRRTVSVSDIDDNVAAHSNSQPVSSPGDKSMGTSPRRFSLCDLDTVELVSPNEDSKKANDYFSGHHTGSNHNHHHRRNSIALRFQSPRSIED